MAHPFFRHFCAVFLATLCFVGIFKLNNNNPSKIVTTTTSKENSSDDFEGFENAERLQLDGLRSFGGGKNESVYFLGLFEESTKFGVRRREGESEVSAARLAVDHVNRMGVLPGYTLRLLINDTKVRDKSFQISCCVREIFKDNQRKTDDRAVLSFLLSSAIRGLVLIDSSTRSTQIAPS